MEIRHSFSLERAFGFGFAILNSQPAHLYKTIIWDFVIVFICWEYRCEFIYPKKLIRNSPCRKASETVLTPYKLDIFIKTV